MVLFGGLAAICLIAGFGLAMYEYELRWQIVNAVHSVRPDLEPFMLFARARSVRATELLKLYRKHFPEDALLKKRRLVFLAAPACFVLGAVFLVLACTHS
jgi:hypothetical protein